MFPRPTPRPLAGVRGGISEGPAVGVGVPCEYLQLLPNLQFPLAKLKQGLWLQDKLVKGTTSQQRRKYFVEDDILIGKEYPSRWWFLLRMALED